MTSGGSQENFSSAIKRFNDGLCLKAQRLIPHKDDASHKFASNITHLIKSKNSKRRTTSYVNFRINEESDEEDSDFEVSTLADGKAIDMDTTDERGRQKGSFKKNSSNVNLLNMSTISASSNKNLGFP